MVSFVETVEVRKGSFFALLGLVWAWCCVAMYEFAGDVACVCGMIVCVVEFWMSVMAGAVAVASSGKALVCGGPWQLALRVYVDAHGCGWRIGVRDAILCVGLQFTMLLVGGLLPASACRHWGWTCGYWGNLVARFVVPALIFFATVYGNTGFEALWVLVAFYRRFPFGNVFERTALCAVGLALWLAQGQFALIGVGVWLLVVAASHVIRVQLAARAACDPKVVRETWTDRNHISAFVEIVVSGFIVGYANATLFCAGSLDGLKAYGKQVKLSWLRLSSAVVVVQRVVAAVGVAAASGVPLARSVPGAVQGEVDCDGVQFARGRVGFGGFGVPNVGVSAINLMPYDSYTDTDMARTGEFRHVAWLQGVCGVTRVSREAQMAVSVVLEKSHEWTGAARDYRRLLALHGDALLRLQTVSRQLECSGVAPGDVGAKVGACLANKTMARAVRGLGLEVVVAQDAHGSSDGAIGTRFEAVVAVCFLDAENAGKDGRVVLDYAISLLACVCGTA